MRKNTKTSFLSRLTKMNNGCWLWQGAKDGKGYGMIRLASVNKKVHRLSYEHFKGQIPKGMLVCHKCDNPPCANPEHLFLGTNQDNADDKMQKRRHAAFSRTRFRCGHLIANNYYLRKRDNSRQCKICNKERCRLYNKKRIRNNARKQGNINWLHA